MNNGFIDLADGLIDAARHQVGERARHSYESYHAKGVTYLNLLRSPELTCKIYLFDGSHKPNADGLVVDPHSHAYPFHSTVLYGSMQNVTFTETDPLSVAESARPWHHFRVESGKAVAPSFRNTRAVKFLHANGRGSWLESGATYFLAPDEVHSIVVPTGEMTILFLCQYARERTATSLYRRTPDAVVTGEGLYQRMTEKAYEEKLSLVRSLLDLGTPEAKPAPSFAVGDCVITARNLEPKDVSPHGRHFDCIGEVMAVNDSMRKAMVRHASGNTAEYLYSELSTAQWTDWPMSGPHVPEAAKEAAAWKPHLAGDFVSAVSPFAGEQAPPGYVRASSGVLVDLRDPDNLRRGMVFETTGKDHPPGQRMVLIARNMEDGNHGAEWECRGDGGGMLDVWKAVARGSVRFVGMDPAVALGGRSDCERFGLVKEADATDYGFARTRSGHACDLRKMRNLISGMVFKDGRGNVFTARCAVDGDRKWAFVDARHPDQLVVLSTTYELTFYGMDQTVPVYDAHPYVCNDLSRVCGIRCDRAIGHHGDHEKIGKGIRWGRS